MPVTNEMHVMRIEVVNIFYSLITFLSKVSFESPVSEAFEREKRSIYCRSELYVK